MVATWSMLTPSLIMATTRSGTRFRNLTPWPPSLRGKGGNCFATPPPSPSGTVDFRRGYGSLPLKKGSQEGFDPASVGQIPLCPPFSKGEPDADSTTLHLSTLPPGRGGQGVRAVLRTAGAAGMIGGDDVGQQTSPTGWTDDESENSS